MYAVIEQYVWLYISFSLSDAVDNEPEGMVCPSLILPCVCKFLLPDRVLLEDLIESML